jgi:K(+)-stimulated pyrophosphate-energized sodium pump
MKKIKFALAVVASMLLPMMLRASEADLVIPADMRYQTILYWGFLITIAGFLFGLFQFLQVKKIRAHKSMLDMVHSTLKCNTFIKGF